MGGQACVLYGAAEFSRDVDFAILADTGNLRRLRSALKELQAEVIAVPGFTPGTCGVGMRLISVVFIRMPRASGSTSCRE